MQLAHDLQMRLLPSPSALVPVARVAARVVPAESVGGDFYNLFRLGDTRAGIMVGDVSGHGYPAALIMALLVSQTRVEAEIHTPYEVVAGAVIGTLVTLILFQVFR